MKFYYVIMLFLILAACSRSNDRDLKQPSAEMIDKENPAKITFSETTHDFGKIAANETMVHDFEFVNDGGSVLIITDVDPSCGCTVPSWPEEPIPPGEKGKITIKFNSGMVGVTKKSITIAANTYPETLTHIYIQGEVVE